MVTLFAIFVIMFSAAIAVYSASRLFGKKKPPSGGRISYF